MIKATTTIESFNVATKIQRCADTESVRYSLDNVRVAPCAKRKNHVTLTATDGRLLATRVEPGNVAEPVLLPVELFPTTQKPVEISATDDEQWSNGSKQSKSADGRFPTVQSVLNTDGLENTFALSIDATFVAKLADALIGKIKKSENTAPVLTLLFTLPKSGKHVVDAVRVVGPAERPNGAAVLMPCQGDIRDARKRFADIVREL